MLMNSKLNRIIKMKSIFILALIVIIMTGNALSTDKIDLTVKPEPLPAQDFKFPDFKEAKLSNGAKLFVVQDNEQPTFSIRLLIPGGSALDGNQPGMADLLTDMLTKGAGKRSALDIANELDGIGASINASATNDYITISASGLKKHMPKVLEIFSDIVTKPTFPNDEFKKLIPQKLSALKNEKSNTSVLASKLSNMVIYGEHHPYGKFTTEKSIQSITVDDLKAYYNAVIKPTNASIIVVGDVTEKEAINSLNKALDNWKPGKVAEINIPPAKPMPIGVYFIHRPASVQSTVFIGSVAPPQADPEWEIQSLGSAIMGGGFGSRLFRTLREKYSYTYSPRAQLSSNKNTNKFISYADVRNSVTDSSITVMLELLNDLSNNPSPEDEIGRIKKYRVGQYLMAFENPSFIAGLIQNADFNGIPLDWVKKFPERFLNYSPYEVQRVAKKYMSPLNSFIIVVGDPEVRPKLEKFGKIYDFDLDLNPISGEKAKMEKVSMDDKELIQAYIDAIGGRKALNSLSTLKITADAKLNAQGQEIPGTLTQYYKKGGKMYMNLDMSVINQTTWCDGDNAWSKGPAGNKQLEGNELNDMKRDAQMFPHTKLLENGFKCNVMGKQQGMIIMKALNTETNKERTYYFDAETKLLSKFETIEKTPRGDMPIQNIFSDYIDLNGIKVPARTEIINPMFSISFVNTYTLNEELDDSLFAPQE